MASEVDICNLALSHIGDKAKVSSIDPPDPTVQSEHCARFYPISRDMAQEAAEWNFVKTRIALTSVTNPLNSWAFAYNLPNLHLKALKVLLPSEINEADTQDFTIETNAAGMFELYTNVEDATLVYLKSETNTLRFSPSFILAQSWLLASFIAGPILKGKTGVTQRESAYTMYLTLLPAAAAHSMNQQQNSAAYKTYTPGWMSDR